MSLKNVTETAQALKCKPTSLYDRRFRSRIGLVAVKIGKSLRFDSGDIERVIRKGREKVSMMPSSEHGGQND